MTYLKTQLPKCKPNWRRLSQGRRSLSALLVSLIAGTCFAAPALAQSQVSGAFNADNQFMVVVTDGPTNVVSTPVNTANTGYRWNQTKRFNFQLYPEEYKECTINVISWGDGSTAEGLAGVLKGPNGQVFTGGPGSQGFPSALDTGISSSMLGPNGSTLNAILSAPGGSTPTNIKLATQSSGTWGLLVNKYNSSDFIGNVHPLFAWVKPQGVGTTSRNYWRFRVPCSQIAKPPKPRNGMTFGLSNPIPEPVNGVAHVGCKDAAGIKCDPYNGDTPCGTALPILCINPMKLQKPQHLSEGRWDKWSGGIIGTTNPMAAPNKLSLANQACVAEFGRGWRVAEFHDIASGRSGWTFSAYGNVGTKGKRFWTDIDDQANGVCWDRSQ